MSSTPCSNCSNAFNSGFAQGYATANAASAFKVPGPSATNTNIASTQTRDPVTNNPIATVMNADAETNDPLNTRPIHDDNDASGMDQDVEADDFLNYGPDQDNNDSDIAADDTLRDSTAPDNGDAPEMNQNFENTTTLVNSPNAQGTPNRNPGVSFSPPTAKARTVAKTAVQKHRIRLVCGRLHTFPGARNRVTRSQTKKNFRQGESLLQKKKE